MLSSSAGVVVSAFLLSALFSLVFKGISLKLNFLNPKSIPLVGGISISLAFFAVLFLFWFPATTLPREIQGILLASVVVLVSGIFDDRKELSVTQKFLVQFVAASILVGFGVRTNCAYVGDIFNIVLSILWIIGITNAMNLLDVMDGLAAATALIIISGLCVISGMNGDGLTLTVSLALGGAVLGFLAYNLPPAKIYMGNSGSHFLGLLLAAITLTGRYATLQRPVALLTPLVLLGFPILDTVFLILMRVRKGQSAFSKSDDHMALRLFITGYSKWKTLILMMVLNLFFVGSGILLSKVSNVCALAIFLFVGLVGIFLTKKMGCIEI